MHAAGYGHTGDGRQLAFRVRSSTMRLEVYREGADEALPAPEDVSATASTGTGDLDLEDEVGLSALVRDLLAAAQPGDGSLLQDTVRAQLSRLDSVVGDG
ncbi:MAG: hypothetical protein ABI181_08960 [Mycobacteriaceae bacterium]